MATITLQDGTVVTVHPLSAMVDGTTIVVDPVTGIASAATIATIPSPVTLEFWVSAAGNDASDGSQGTPWKTLSRANLEHEHHVAIAQSVIHLVGAGPFTSVAFDPRPFGGGGRLIIIGDDFVNLTGTLTLGTVSGGGQYLKLVSSPGALDTYIGKTLEMTSGALNGFRRSLRGHQTKLACDFATTVNISLTGSQTVDGVASGNGKRALVKNQSTSTQDGIYVTSSSGAWTRAKDCDHRAKAHDAKVTVTGGTVNAGTTWYQTAYSPIPGTTALVWSQTDLVLFPLETFSNINSDVPSSGNTCVIREPAATITLNSNSFNVGFHPQNYMFKGFTKDDSVNGRQGAYLVNVKFTPGSLGQVSFCDSGVGLFGVDFGSNVTVSRAHAVTLSGVLDANTSAGEAMEWLTTAGVSDYLAWQGWGCNSSASGAFSPALGTSLLHGYIVATDFGNGTGCHDTAIIQGGRFSGGISIKQGDSVFQNCLLDGTGFSASDMGKVTLAEGGGIDGSSVLVSNNTNYVVAATDNGLVFMRSSVLAGHSSALGLCVGGLGGPASKGGGTISFQLTQAVAGDTADVRLYKNDYSMSYFSADGIGVIDDVEPYACGGRVRRTG